VGGSNTAHVILAAKGEAIALWALMWIRLCKNYGIVYWISNATSYFNFKQIFIYYREK
jgi:hypothetical protein